MRPPLKGIGLAVLMYLSGVLGFAVLRWGGHFPLALLPSGLAVAALYRWGLRYWPSLALAGVAIDLSIGGPIAAALGTGVGLAIGAAVTVRLLGRARFDPDFKSVRDVLLFLVVSATGMALTPLIGSFGYWAVGVEATPSYLDSGIRWYATTTAGVYLLAPALLAMHRHSFRRLAQHRLESAVWLLAVLATAAVIALAAGPAGRSVIAMWSLLLIVLGTIRYGLVVSALGALVISSMSAASLAFGFGMFASFGELAGRLTLMAFAATLSSLALTIHALLEERDAAAAERLKVERQYAQIFEGSPQPIWVHDPLSERFLLANAAARRQYGWNSDEFLSQTLQILQIPGERGVLRPAAPRPDVHADIVEPYETRHLTRDGRILEVEVWRRSIELAGRSAELVFAIDVTERRALGRALIDSIGGEQRRIALEMHDGLGQEMTGLSLSLRALATRAEREGAPIARDLEQLSRLSTHCIESARRIVQGLAPLNDAGGSLEMALEVLTSRLATAATAIRLRLPDRAPLLMEPDALNHLYRIAQEAIQNALKHANANLIEVELSTGTNDVVLTVIDDGVGLVPDGERRFPDGERRAGFGMRTMHFRAGAIGGTLLIESRRAYGTSVRCRAPLPHALDRLPRETRHQPFIAKE